MFERLIEMIGKDNFYKLKQIKILLVGVGGVGGYTLEALLRSGIEKITIVDYDTIEESNLNRQIIATSQNITKLKVDEAKKRAEEINPNCCITAISKKLEKEMVKEIISSYDFVIDACDDSKIKKELIIEATKQKISIISCMGTANRLKPELLCIDKLSNTKNDPLAKKIRTLLKKEGKKYLNTPIVYSMELPIKKAKLGTVCTVPMAAGSLLASYVIEKIIEKQVL